MHNRNHGQKHCPTWCIPLSDKRCSVEFCFSAAAIWQAPSAPMPLPENWKTYIVWKKRNHFKHITIALFHGLSCAQKTSFKERSHEIPWYEERYRGFITRFDKYVLQVEANYLASIADTLQYFPDGFSTITKYWRWNCREFDDKHFKTWKIQRWWWQTASLWCDLKMPFEHLWSSKLRSPMSKRLPATGNHF